MRAAAVLALIVALACCDAKTVTKLSDSNFEEFRTSAKHVGVLFQRGPEIPGAVTAAATKLGNDVPFGWFDCDWSKAKKTCAKMEVSIFPSFVFFADKEDAEDYYFMPDSKDLSDGDAIVAYVKSRTGAVSEAEVEAPAKAKAEAEAEADEPTVASDSPAPSAEGGSKSLSEAQLLAWETKILHVHGNEWEKIRLEHPKARPTLRDCALAALLVSASHEVRRTCCAAVHHVPQ
jgi:hypothetical protein